MRRIALITLMVGSGFLILGSIAYLLGVRVNTTKSIPVGFYWLTDAPFEKGAYVIFCPPMNNIFDEARKRGYFSAGFCPGGYGYLMKKILAAKKDTVKISDDGVRVNGVLVAFSKPLIADKGGRPLPKYRTEITLSDSELFLMGDVNKNSFDGRYFGSINRSLIKGVIHPIYTW